MSRNGRTGARDVCLDSVASYFCGRSADAINPMELLSIPLFPCPLKIGKSFHLNELRRFPGNKLPSL